LDVRTIGRYFEFYNQRRPHAGLDGSTPEQAYFTPLPLRTQRLHLSMRKICSDNRDHFNRLACKEIRNG
jgi:hypothetical protein